MKKLLKQHGTAILTILIYLFFVLIVYKQCTIKNDSIFVYPLDDSYIHLAISNNFAENGVFGITQYEFTSSSSSLIWTLILSAVNLVFGRNDLLPFFLCIFLSIILIVYINKKLLKYSENKIYNFLLLNMAFYSASIFSLTFTGLEHILQALLVIIYIFTFSEIIFNNSFKNVIPKNNFKKERINKLLIFYFITFLLPLVRYESIFLIFSVGLLFFINKQFKRGLFTIIFGALPLVILGLFFISKGWYFFPNSVLLKSELKSSMTDSVISFIKIFLHNLYHSPYLFSILVIGALYLFYNKFILKIETGAHTIFIQIIIFTILLHLAFAKIGWFYRYEAYLVFSGVVFIGIILPDFLRNLTKKSINILKIKIVFSLLFIFFTSPLFLRIYEANFNIVKATHNIYEQQYQLASFIAKYFNKSSIALNDIGLISYKSKIKSLDLTGLANMDAAKLKRTNNFNTINIATLLKKYSIDFAVIYDTWFYNETALPKNWQRVSRWIIHDNFICGDSVVSIYAKDSSIKANLIKNIEEFQPSLPSGINIIIDRNENFLKY